MADKLQTILKQIESLAKRMEKLESATAARPASQQYAAPAEECHHLGQCSLPRVPERVFATDVSPRREELIRYIGKKWVNGTKLKYYFFKDGPFRGVDSNMDLVRAGFKTWADLGIGIEFEEVDDINDGQVRIGFQRGDGAWSYVGRDVIDIPGRHERTMNFGWDLTQDPRGGGLDTPIHEIGHTLGFPHEHQNPFSGIVWDEEEVYRRFAGSPNFWPRERTFHNVLRKLERSAVEGSEWDPNSIMHYSFGSGLIVEPAQYRNGLRPEDGLSEADIAEVRKFYPPIDARRYKKLNDLEVEHLDVAPGEQKDFVIVPERTDDFTIQTFGRSDAVMVLFEDVDGDHQFLAGDDDSGTNLNASITARLVKGRRYILRIRLFTNWATGRTAVMMW